MTLLRFSTLIFGLILIIGLSLWLIDSLSRLHWQLSYSPLLGNLLLFLLIILIGGLIIVFVYYLLRLNRGDLPFHRARKQIKIPAGKSEAASLNLKALRQELCEIQDEITRQAILSKSQEIEANLVQGEIQVVVFGTGSAGKTSLVNAVMGKMVGKVNAPMGTTVVGGIYRLQLKGLERKILIIDTPGILEVGVVGTEREQLARKLATEADLLLFVVDNDLRYSEYKPLQTLASIGKRLILVFNKTDLYTYEDQKAILKSLRQRVNDLIPANNVVAIAASPQVVELDNGEVFQSEADILPLLRLMAEILRAEGENLVADNILLQSLKLGEEVRKLIDLQRFREAEKIVGRFQWISAGVVAVTPLPMVDLLATAAVNAQMVVEIGRIYGCELNMERGKELALSLTKTITSLGIVKGALQLLTTALQINASTLIVGRAIQGTTTAYLTRIAGKSFIEYFRNDQDWGDGGMVEMVQHQFQLNHRNEFIQAFIQEAILQVVKPIMDNQSEVTLEDIHSSTSIKTNRK